MFTITALQKGYVNALEPVCSLGADTQHAELHWLEKGAEHSKQLARQACMMHDGIILQRQGKLTN